MYPWVLYVQTQTKPLEPCAPSKGGNRRSHCAIRWDSSGILLPLVQHLHKAGSVESTDWLQHITTCCITTFLYKLHYNILQQITTYYNISGHFTRYYKTFLHIPPVSCSKRSIRLFRWISGPAVLSVINFVLRRSPWVDKHQARPMGQRERKKKDDERILKLARCVWVYMSNRKNPGNTKYVFDGHWFMEIDGNC